MAEITGFKVGLAGGKPTFAAAAAGDTARCGVGWKLIVKNAAVADITVTIAVPGTLEQGIANPDKTYIVPAAVSSVPGEQWIPLYDFYADDTDSLAHISYTSLTTITRALVKG